MTCRLARTHPVPTGKTHLQIQFHGENTPALPAERKGKSGRILLRQLRDYPAATVADFSTAVLSISPVAADSGDRLLSEPTAGIQPCRREPLFMPHCGHSQRAW